MKRSVLGVLVDACDYTDATQQIIGAAVRRQSFAGTAVAVHGIMESWTDPALCRQLNSFDLVAPDGQPVRWALNLLHDAHLRDRVYGPDLVVRLLAEAARGGLPVYFYGSTRGTVGRVALAMKRKYPKLIVAGCEPSKFRGAAPGEAEEIAGRITGSGARILLVGLGCPRQERFVYAMRPLLPMPVLAVGAAFAYLAGDLRTPPMWMQQHALEWAWRLAHEPRRLWRRYVLANPAFLALLGAQKAHVWRAVPPPPAGGPPSRFSV
jgi:exopolysaccharide biosynthesis WecB/TagA/CpsF family protein